MSQHPKDELLRQARPFVGMFATACHPETGVELDGPLYKGARELLPLIDAALREQQPQAPSAAAADAARAVLIEAYEFWAHYSTMPEPDQDEINDQRHAMLKKMSDTIAALRSCSAAAPAAREGWVLVPREPTPKMGDAGAEEVVRQYNESSSWEEAKDACENLRVIEIYRAMLAAAPQQTKGKS